MNRMLYWILPVSLAVLAGSLGGCTVKAERVGSGDSELVLPSLGQPNEVSIEEVRLSQDGSLVRLRFRVEPNAAVVWSRSQIVLEDVQSGRKLPLAEPTARGSEYLMPKAGREGVLVFRNLDGVVKTGGTVEIRLGTTRTRLAVGAP